jgi:hypothetical protein
MPIGNITNGSAYIPSIGTVHVANPNQGTVQLPGGGIGVIVNGQIHVTR